MVCDFCYLFLIPGDDILVFVFICVCMWICCLGGLRGREGEGEGRTCSIVVVCMKKKASLEHFFAYIYCSFCDYHFLAKKEGKGKKERRVSLFN